MSLEKGAMSKGKDRLSTMIFEAAMSFFVGVMIRIVTYTFETKINHSCRFKLYQWNQWIGRISQILHLLVVQLGLRSDLTGYHDHVVLSSWVIWLILTHFYQQQSHKKGLPNVGNEHISPYFKKYIITYVDIILYNVYWLVVSTPLKNILVKMGIFPK